MVKTVSTNLQGDLKAYAAFVKFVAKSNDCGIAMGKLEDKRTKAGTLSVGSAKVSETRRVVEIAEILDLDTALPHIPCFLKKGTTLREAFEDLSQREKTILVPADCLELKPEFAPSSVGGASDTAGDQAGSFQDNVVVAGDGDEDEDEEEEEDDDDDDDEDEGDDEGDDDADDISRLPHFAVDLEADDPDDPFY
jgi:hypothetical protein